MCIFLLGPCDINNSFSVFTMSAIKRFFEKKKTDAKFKLAGGGQKLGDSAAAQDAAQKRAAALASAQNRAGSSGSSRGQQLSQEKRLAATAALERYVCYVSPLSGRKIWFNFRQHQWKLSHFTS